MAAPRAQMTAAGTAAGSASWVLGCWELQGGKVGSGQWRTDS